jgi:hypothetical protein
LVRRNQNWQRNQARITRAARAAVAWPSKIWFGTPLANEVIPEISRLSNTCRTTGFGATLLRPGML